jgi:DNA-binding response OmpR family regulator
MLTAKNREADLRTGFAMKVDDYLSKPFKVSELMMRIDRILLKNMG